MVRKTDADPPVRTSITVRKSLMDKIEAYRDKHGLVTTADALRELLQAGVESKRKAAR